VKPAVLARAVELIHSNNDHFDTGFVGTPLVLDVLSAEGHHDLAYKLMTQPGFPGFGHMLARGATTLWEDWDGRSSRMHPMFGGACRWLWQHLAGLRPDPAHPGFARFFVEPRSAPGLDWLRASYESLRGPISIEWTRSASSLKLKLEVPPNSQALVTLPGAQPRQLGPGSHSL